MELAEAAPVAIRSGVELARASIDSDMVAEALPGRAARGDIEHCGLTWGTTGPERAARTCFDVNRRVQLSDAPRATGPVREMPCCTSSSYVLASIRRRNSYGGR